jgi:hypothetical protein
MRPERWRTVDYRGPPPRRHREPASALPRRPHADLPASSRARGLFAVEFAVLAIGPNSRSDWLLENALSIAAVAALALTYRRFRFSRVSYTMIFVFLSLHEIGAHYTYSLVPYDAACQRWLGFSLDAALGFERNMFDRWSTSRTGCCSPIRSARSSCASSTCAASGATSCRST